MLLFKIPSGKDKVLELLVELSKKKKRVGRRSLAYSYSLLQVPGRKNTTFSKMHYAETKGGI